jgi:hypothetical protein
VGSATDSHGLVSRFSRPVAAIFQSNSSSIIITRLYFSENLVEPEIEPGTCGTVARKSDH